jgi:DNA (cytosine-5)-methyltransferase 1
MKNKTKMKNTQVFTFIDLFAGIGGFHLACHNLGGECVFASEWDSFARETYTANFKDKAPVLFNKNGTPTSLYATDITKVDISTIPEFNLLCAGFPCQPFSIAGLQKGFKDRDGNLFFEIMRFVDTLQPSVIFLENVANLVEHDRGRTFNVIHNELSEREYYIRYLVADACDYGIPQHRTRTYIVAFRNFAACNSFAFPQPRSLGKRIFDVIDKTSRAADGYYLPVDSFYCERLNSFMKDDDQIYRFSDYGIQASRDGISFTLKANMGTWKERIPYIRDIYGIRKITPKECLALQGFPSEFSFRDIPIRSAYKQCGNTVVVPIIKEIADQISKVLI